MKRKVYIRLTLVDPHLQKFLVRYESEVLWTVRLLGTTYLKTSGRINYLQDSSEVFLFNFSQQGLLTPYSSRKII